MKTSYRSLLLFLFFCTCQAQSIPTLHGRSLAGGNVNLPLEFEGKVGVLVVGFSKRSGENAKPWGEAIASEFAKDPNVVYYQVPVLAEVPSFIRGLVVQSMRHSMTSAEQAHSVPVFQNEAQWKESVGFSSPDDAYVLVLNRAGIVTWRTHGAMTASSRGELLKAIRRVN